MRTILGIGIVVVACAAILLGVLFLASDRAGESSNQTSPSVAKMVNRGRAGEADRATRAGGV